MACIVVGIAGGTGSGKSTFTNRLKKEFTDHVTVLYHDDYYRRHDSIPLEDRKKLNYDHPDALETDLLISHIHALKAGNPVSCPVYDFSLHNRTERVKTVTPAPIILVEGILVLQDERLRELCDIKIYVDSDADERILRRALRDVKDRGRSLEDVTEQYLTTVKQMHYLYVEPTKALADIIINSGLGTISFDIVKTKLQAFLDEET